jgi:hypothetical protein
MHYKKESLNKLLDFISEIAKEKENEWFKQALISKIVSIDTHNPNESAISEIYEYCIRLIIKDHAAKFYKDFKLIDIKDALINDFIRMEKFRREDNFEDFCLAAFQQLEAIVNKLCIDHEIGKYFIENKNTPAILKFDRETNDYVRRGNQTVGKLIFQTSDEQKINDSLGKNIQHWYFNQKYRAVLYYYYYNTEIIATSDNYDKIYDVGNYLYQGRNLNHRGSVPSQFNQTILEVIVPNQHKYYFKFLGFLEDFVSGVNLNI